MSARCLGLFEIVNAVEPIFLQGYFGEGVLYPGENPPELAVMDMMRDQDESRVVSVCISPGLCDWDEILNVACDEDALFLCRERKEIWIIYSIQFALLVCCSNVMTALS